MNSSLGLKIVAPILVLGMSVATPMFADDTDRSVWELAQLLRQPASTFIDFLVREAGAVELNLESDNSR